MPSLMDYQSALSGQDVWATEPAQPLLTAPKDVIPLAGGISVLVQGTPPQWLAPCVESFTSLMALPTNWDTYGARVIDPRAVYHALVLLTQTMGPTSPAPQVVPTSQGHVQLEWHRRGIDFQVLVAPSGRYSAAFEREGGTTEMSGVISQTKPIADSIRALER